jgi:hypothetical protein
MGNPSRYIKGAKLHQALEALSRMPLNETDLKRKINFTASVPRFIEHIINPLFKDRMTHRDGMYFKITPLGEETLQELGRIKTHLPAVEKYTPEGSYDGKELLGECIRPSGDDHFKHPSRRNDMLYYRDGRVEAV